jgi:hypothetical protein
MIRYVNVNGEKLILHAFVQTQALVEEPATGKVKLVNAVDCTFEPPTEIFLREQALAQMRAAAANSGGRLVKPVS